MIDKKNVERFFSAKEVADLQEYFTWAQCERCEKWRVLFDADSEELPEKWYCEMNTDTQNNSCDRPQRSQRWYEMEETRLTALARGEDCRSLVQEEPEGLSSEDEDRLRQNDQLLKHLLDICQMGKKTKIVAKHVFHDILVKPTDDQPERLTTNESANTISPPKPSVEGKLSQSGMKRAASPIASPNPTRSPRVLCGFPSTSDHIDQEVSTPAMASTESDMAYVGVKCCSHMTASESAAQWSSSTTQIPLLSLATKEDAKDYVRNMGDFECTTNLHTMASHQQYQDDGKQERESKDHIMEKGDSLHCSPETFSITPQTRKSPIRSMTKNSEARVKAIERQVIDMGDARQEPDRFAPSNAEQKDTHGASNEKCGHISAEKNNGRNDLSLIGDGWTGNSDKLRSKSKRQSDNLRGSLPHKEHTLGLVGKKRKKTVARKSVLGERIVHGRTDDVTATPRFSKKSKPPRPHESEIIDLSMDDDE